MEMKCPICGNEITSGNAECPQCGFKLTGKTQSFKPVELDGAIEASSTAKQPSESYLRVLRGPYVDTVFPLGDKPISIGRSPVCDICLSDMTVSREHARIVPDDGGFAIEDCNSFNGVWVNNSSIESHHLMRGDIVQIGTFSLVYQEV